MEENNNMKPEVLLNAKPLSYAKKRTSRLYKKDSWTGSPIIMSPHFGEDCGGNRPSKNKVHPLSCLKEQTSPATSTNESIQLSRLTEQGPNLGHERTVSTASNEEKERKRQRKRKLAVLLTLATLVSLLVIILSWKLLASTDREPSSNQQQGGEDINISMNVPTSHQTSLDYNSVNQGGKASTARPQVISLNKTEVTEEDSKTEEKAPRTTLYNNEALTNGKQTSTFAHGSVWETKMELSMEFTGSKTLTWKGSRTSAEAATSRKQSSLSGSWNSLRNGRSSSLSDKNENKVKTTAGWVLQKTLPDDSDYIITGSATSNPPRRQSTHFVSQGWSTATFSHSKSVKKDRSLMSSPSREEEKNTPAATASYGTVIQTKLSPGLTSSAWQTSLSFLHNLERFSTIFQSSTAGMKLSPSQTERATYSGIYTEASTVMVSPSRMTTRSFTKTLPSTLVTLETTPVLYNSVKSTKVIPSYIETGMRHTKGIQQTATFAKGSQGAEESSQDKISVTEISLETQRKTTFTSKEHTGKTSNQTMPSSYLSVLSSHLQTSVKIPEKTQEQASLTTEILGKNTDNVKFRQFSTTEVHYQSASAGLGESEATSSEKTTSALTSLLRTISSYYTTSHIQARSVAVSSAAVVLPPCTKGNFDSFPHPTDCSEYIECIGGLKGIVRSCPKGTLFDPKTKSCNHQDKVKCNKMS